MSQTPVGRHRRDPADLSLIRGGPALGDLVSNRYRLRAFLDTQPSDMLQATDERLHRDVRLQFVDLNPGLADLLHGPVANRPPAMYAALPAVLDSGHDLTLNRSFVTMLPTRHIPLALMRPGGLVAAERKRVLLAILDTVSQLHHAGLGHSNLNASNIRIGATPAEGFPVEIGLNGIYGLPTSHARHGTATDAAAEARQQDLHALAEASRSVIGPFALRSTRTRIATPMGWNWTRLIAALNAEHPLSTYPADAVISVIKGGAPLRLK